MGAMTPMLPGSTQCASCVTGHIGKTQVLCTTIYTKDECS